MDALGGLAEAATGPSVPPCLSVLGSRCHPPRGLRPHLQRKGPSSVGAGLAEAATGPSVPPCLSVLGSRCHPPRGLRPHLQRKGPSSVGAGLVEAGTGPSVPPLSSSPAFDADPCGLSEAAYSPGHLCLRRNEVRGWRRLVGWLVALAGNCQHEASTPGPRFAVSACGDLPVTDALPGPP